MKKIGIIGIGNPLRKDDGVGIVLLARIQQRKTEFPEHFVFIDGGTGGMNLLHLLVRFDRVLIIDAVNFRGKPGEAHVFHSQELLSKKTPVTVSTHESDFLNVLRLSNELKELPQTLVIFGVQPRDVSQGMGLSEEIELALDDLYMILQKEIHALVT